ncbi:M23 family metallopeptidase [Bradyrhizobium sp. SYSU BS000235]|uniref:M23 family metallopeptidase n=1 Tax=Bradyrhizobium sp. SYSU BS000235 TaxID=3411332 RepID=UPI003C77D5A0
MMWRNPWLYTASLIFFGVVLNPRLGAAEETIQLKMPVACDIGRTCYIQNYVDIDPAPSAKDYRCGTLSYDAHNGTDFRLPTMKARRAGVDVIAAAAGRVARVRDGVPEGVFLKSGRDAVKDMECGNGVVIEHPGRWETQYCHMAKGSIRVKPGDDVSVGQPLGQIGLSGLTEYPHLHLTVRHESKIVDPFAYGAPENSCSGGKSLWDASLQGQLTYREREVLNAGFSTGAVTMDMIENGEAEKDLFSRDAPALVVFVRAIGLKTGDIQKLVLHSPSGQVVAENRAAALATNKAQVMLFAGRKRLPNGWDAGVYRAKYTVERDGHVVLEKDIVHTLP